MHLYPPSKRVCARAAITLLVLFFSLIVAGHLPATHAAATFTVNSLLDTPDAAPGNGTCADLNGACTLRAAIQETNSLSGDDTINFSVTGTINLTGALPALSSNVAINGPGSALLTVRRDIGGNYRIFQSSGTSSISGLTITNGRTPDAITEDIAPLGGGIWQTGGSLTLRDVVITANRTGNGGSMRFNSPNLGGFGGFGGGIYATGTLTMTDCVISNNTTGKGGDGTQFGGSGGRGAGMYFGPGTLKMTNVVVSGNQTGAGGGPHSGNSGDGGGLWTGNDAFPNQATDVTLNKVTITDNTTATAVANGDTGIGGGIVVIQGTMTMTDSTVKNNHTGDAPARSSGRGGGIFNNATLIIRNSLISGNSTGDNSAGSNNNGGGIASHSSLTLINTTVSGNSTGADTAGIGGGVFVFNFATLINCTVTGNSTPGDHANGVGGFGAVITLANTIVAGNGDSANDKDLENTLFSAPTFVSQGHNLIGNADGVSGFNGVGDQVGTTAAPLNPHLGPLADNGGPSLTHALLSNSTALDAGSNALAKNPDTQLETDQRGAARIADSLDPDSLAVVDIGAFEFHQTLEDIANKTTNEDTPITVTFGLGDNGPAVTSVTASSNNQVVVPNANLVVSGTGAARSLQITPAANQSGLTMITVTVNLSGGGSLNDTFTLNVNPVNDRPSFFLLGAPAVLEDAGAQTVNLVTNINVGPLETQTVSFTATVNTNAGLFSVAPAIDSAGTLTYTPAPNAFGDAIVTVVMKDNGGTANGGIDTSIEQAFTISITSVNDVPTFTKGANQAVNEDAGFQFVSNWATNVSQGPNESDGLSFQVTNNTNPGLFSQQPAVAINGLLTYVPASNASGSADITIVLKDTGGTANGGVDISAPQTFTITVTPVNDAPLIGLQSPFVQTNQQTPLVFSAANFNGIGLSDVDAGADPIRVTLTATQGTLTLPSTAGLTFVAGDGTDDTTMTFTGFIGLINSRLSGLTFKPNNGFAGSASLQIIADDDGHNGTGGAKSTTANISINVVSGGRFSFNTSTYGVNETGGTATITVLRAGGTAGTATVNYATSDGTATAGASCTSGVDYIPASGSFTWNNGDASVRQFTITICNDGTNENDETISLTLSNAGGTGSLGTQPTAFLTIGNDDAPVLLTEELTDHAIALDLVNQTRDPFSLTSLFNLGDDEHRRVSLFVWRLGLLPSDTVASVQVVARDDEGRTYDLPVEALNPTALVADVTQVVVRLPDSVIGAPRDLRVKVTLRGPGTNEAVIKIAAP
ncbi:MAG TPA: choice-of-anchor Q domain-containing protein [Pyrinomonadaceae bacterium]|nr:choice-of-anchor Q domain-containing protein [Pyrinomonadaceae bacterium]